jgi:hypothetical protein
MRDFVIFTIPTTDLVLCQFNNDVARFGRRGIDEKDEKYTEKSDEGSFLQSTT